MKQILLLTTACAFLGAALALKNPPAAQSSPSMDRAPAATAAAPAPQAPHPPAAAVAPTTEGPSARLQQLPFMAGAQVVESHEGMEGDSRVRRSILRTDMKYPYVLVVERISASGAVSEPEAMAADHVIVRLKDGGNPAELASAVEAFGGRLKPMGKSPFYLVLLPSHGLGDLDHALQRLQNRPDLVENAGPDRIVSAL